jgi:hypothetical protein
VQFPGIDRIDYLALDPTVRQTAFFMSPSVRSGLADGRADLLSLDYPGIVRHLRTMPPVDVAMAQLTPPDGDGWCSAGLASDFAPLVWTPAKRRIAHLNPRLPRTRGSFRVHVSELDGMVEADAPLIEYAESNGGAVEARIGMHVTAFVRDGDTLQFGIGSVPSALADCSDGSSVPARACRHGVGRAATAMGSRRARPRCAHHDRRGARASGIPRLSPPDSSRSGWPTLRILTTSRRSQPHRASSRSMVRSRSTCSAKSTRKEFRVRSKRVPAGYRRSRKAHSPRRAAAC